eukprot:TRINITY_DN10647_c0_g1_i10.p1 TRINITY_DN10647_c0_g1~~TRINITY_DN10647_c0_g1_i10.p1  ORF type:complete len:414 (-),score=130.85 TRINITY_DN10647_c0_g1_i10:487-1707(-)
MIRRPPRSTRKESSAASDVYKRQEGKHLGDIEINTLQRVLWLSDFFKMTELQDICIQHIVPLLSKDNVLIFLEDSFAKINSAALSESSEIKDCWISLYQECLNIAAVNIPFLVKVESPGLHNMDSIILEGLAEKAFKKFISNVNSDNGAIIDLLVKYKKMSNPYDLLEYETQRVHEKEKASFTAENAVPTLTWSLTGLKGHFYKDSGPFLVFGNCWELTIWSSQQDGTVTVAIKHDKVRKEEIKNSQVFGKLSGKSANAVKLSERKDGQENFMEEDVEAFPPQCIITLASLVRLVEFEPAGEGSFQIASLIAGSKSRTTLRVFQAEELVTTSGKLTVELSLKSEYTYSGILTYISRNFNWLYHHPAIRKLTKNQLLTLLKHKFLNAKTEEDVVAALCLWCKFRISR